MSGVEAVDLLLNVLMLLMIAAIVFYAVRRL